MATQSTSSASTPIAPSITLTGKALTLDQVVQVACYNAIVNIDDSVWPAVEAARKVVDDKVKNKEIVYGVSTGFGSLCRFALDNDKDIIALQKNLILSHSVGVGPDCPIEIVKAMMLLTINKLIRGNSGVQVSTIKHLQSCLNANIIPVIPLKGSVGASGDLCPLSHMISALFFGKGKLMDGRDAQVMMEMKPPPLLAKEGLALNNGTQFICANLSLGMYRLDKMIGRLPLIIGAIFHVLKATGAAFDPRPHAVRNHKGQQYFAKMIRILIKDTPNYGQVQDAYSIRCSPQILGSIFEIIPFLKKIIINEINASTDNPLVFAEDGSIISAGNFHGQYPSIVSDILSILTQNICNPVNTMIDRMTDEKKSAGLPSCLVVQPGLNSGFMMPHYTTSALTSGNKVLCHPASVDSIQTCEGQEDHVSMGAHAARKFLEIVQDTEYVLSIALFNAHQAWQIRMKTDEAFKNSKSVFDTVFFPELAKVLPYIEDDIFMKSPIDAATEFYTNMPSCEAFIAKNLPDALKAENSTTLKTLMHAPRGTVDIVGKDCVIMNDIFNRIRQTMKIHGIDELQTPIMEHTRVLQGNYGEDEKLIFNLKEDGGTPKSLRYDHTGPFGRFLAQHKLVRFSRFTIGPVFRQDNVNVSSGRYRQFYQADLDIAGVYASMIPDATVVTVFMTTLKSMDINCNMLVNHRKILDGIFLICDVPEAKLRPVCSGIDKLDKHPWEVVESELVNEKDIPIEVAAKLKTFFAVQVSDPSFDTFKKAITENPIFKAAEGSSGYNMLMEGINDLDCLMGYLNADVLAGIRWTISLARGLDYYTGMIFEVICPEHRDVGSISAGGRYDKMVGELRGDNEDVPCVGASFGVQRIITIINRMNKKVTPAQMPLKVLVTPPSESLPARQYCSKVATDLRNNGIPTLLNMGVKPRIKDQFTAAFENDVTHMVIIGDDEAQKGIVQVKDVSTKRDDGKYTQTTLDTAKLVEYLKEQRPAANVDWFHV